MAGGTFDRMIREDPDNELHFLIDDLEGEGPREMFQFM